MSIQVGQGEWKNDAGKQKEVRMVRNGSQPHYEISSIVPSFNQSGITLTFGNCKGEHPLNRWSTYLSRSLALITKHLSGGLGAEFCARKGKANRCRNKLPSGCVPSTSGFRAQGRKSCTEEHRPCTPGWTWLGGCRDSRQEERKLRQVLSLQLRQKIRGWTRWSLRTLATLICKNARKGYSKNLSEAFKGRWRRGGGPSRPGKSVRNGLQIAASTAFWWTPTWHPRGFLLNCTWL